jgi:hypothetical protein
MSDSLIEGTKAKQKSGIRFSRGEGMKTGEIYRKITVQFGS